jgi:hypothetical protein
MDMAGETPAPVPCDSPLTSGREKPLVKGSLKFTEVVGEMANG